MAYTLTARSPLPITHERTGGYDSERVAEEALRKKSEKPSNQVSRRGKKGGQDGGEKMFFSF